MRGQKLFHTNESRYVVGGRSGNHLFDDVGQGGVDTGDARGPS